MTMTHDLIVAGEALPTEASAIGATLPSLITRASTSLAAATTAAEVLEAREFATGAYDAAKRMARLAKAKNAHDVVIAAVYRAQADALLIESHAKSRLADEYDAAQERGEVASQGKPVNLPDGNVMPTVGDIGLTPKMVHEARQIRDAEKATPGATEKALNDRLAMGEEPTRAALKRDLGVAAKQARATEDQQNDRRRQKMADQLPDHAKASMAWAEQRRSTGAEKSTSATDLDALKAQVDEQAENIVALETDLAEARRQVAQYDDMAVQFEQGGFDKVVAGKDEEIRVLETRLYTTSADMASWRRKAGWEEKEKLRYKAEAEKRGYSDDIDMDDIDPATGEVING